MPADIPITQIFIRVANTVTHTMNGFAPPVQPGIHLTTEDGQFKIAVSLRNPTDEPIRLRTMTTALFNLSMNDKHDGRLWAPGTMAGQAVTHWTLAAGGRITRHYTVPNEETARETAREHIDERRELLYDDDEEVTIVTAPVYDRPNRDEYDGAVHYQTAVEPEEVGIVQIEAGIPSGNDYYNTITRQFDLRTRPDRVLDDELPDETMEDIESTM